MRHPRKKSLKSARHVVVLQYPLGFCQKPEGRWQTYILVPAINGIGYWQVYIS